MAKSIVMNNLWKRVIGQLAAGRLPISALEQARATATSRGLTLEEYIHQRAAILDSVSARVEAQLQQQ